MQRSGVVLLAAARGAVIGGVRPEIIGTEEQARRKLPIERGRETGEVRVVAHLLVVHLTKGREWPGICPMYQHIEIGARRNMSSVTSDIAYFGEYLER
jgi:hypothetical protein